MTDTADYASTLGARIRELKGSINHLKEDIDSGEQFLSEKLRRKVKKAIDGIERHRDRLAGVLDKIEKKSA